MDTMILAAGFGTRLLPHTATVPKPLFPLNDRAILDITLDKLERAGAERIVINTHHLSSQIIEFVKARANRASVDISYEPVILDSGGAIRKVITRRPVGPLLVVNADIVFDIDLAAVYRYHLDHPCLATLVLHDFPQFNQVLVSDSDHICGFHKKPPPGRASGHLRCLAFTGIHVIDPGIVAFIPPDRPYSIIDAYQSAITHRQRLHAWTPPSGSYWIDIGSPEGYRQAAIDTMAPQAFRAANMAPPKRPRVKSLPGDGSDRHWFRISNDRNQCLIIADHGIDPSSEVNEFDSCVQIGSHLYKKGLPVPQIYAANRFSGLVCMQDCGDSLLQHLVTTDNHSYGRTIDMYRQIIDMLINFSEIGAHGFNPNWCWQAPAFDHETIIEKECRYFMQSFLIDFAHIEGIDQSRFKPVFEHIAQQALNNAHIGLMHRDFQSRNIMAHENQFFLIDFQGARLGPLQYDLASLLIDPYVNLPPETIDDLVETCIEKLKQRVEIDDKKFYHSYRYCALSRNLQILGAFCHLCLNKAKPAFKQYIPSALSRLSWQLAKLDDPATANLTNIVNLAEHRLADMMQAG